MHNLNAFYYIYLHFQEYYKQIVLKDHINKIQSRSPQLVKKTKIFG